MTKNNETNRDSDGDPAKAAAYLRASALGFQLVITFVVMAAGGLWLDRTLGTVPWGTLGGLLFAMVAMVVILQREGGGSLAEGGADEVPRDAPEDPSEPEKNEAKDDEKGGEE